MTPIQSIPVQPSDVQKLTRYISPHLTTSTPFYSHPADLHAYGQAHIVCFLFPSPLYWAAWKRPTVL